MFDEQVAPPEHVSQVQFPGASFSSPFPLHNCLLVHLQSRGKSTTRSSVQPKKTKTAASDSTSLLHQVILAHETNMVVYAFDNRKLTIVKVTIGHFRIGNEPPFQSEALCAAFHMKKVLFACEWKLNFI